jgi:hypothetical protein
LLSALKALASSMCILILSIIVHFVKGKVKEKVLGCRY